MTNTVSGQVTQFTYDGDGNRVKKVQSGITTAFVGNAYEWTSTSTTKYYYLGGKRVALRTSAGVTYLHGDHLGSASVTSGAVSSSARYYPYGGDRWTSGSMPTDYKFTGQRQESGFGLYDYNARYYDPTLGRFVSADTIVSGAGNPQALNRYAYNFNNPIRYIDPTGHGPNEPCGGGVNPVGKGMQDPKPGCGGPSGKGGESGSGGGDSSGSKPLNVSESQTQVKPIAERPAGGTGNNYDKQDGRGVYVLKEDSKVVYVGQGDARGRLADHANDPIKGKYDQQRVAENNLTKAEARGLEDQLIKQYGGSQSTGGTLLNKNQGISPTNINRDTYLDAAKPLLDEAIRIIEGLTP